MTIERITNYSARSNNLIPEQLKLQYGGSVRPPVPVIVPSAMWKGENSPLNEIAGGPSLVLREYAGYDPRYANGIIGRCFRLSTDEYNSPNELTLPYANDLNITPNGYWKIECYINTNTATYFEIFNIYDGIGGVDYVKAELDFSYSEEFGYNASLNIYDQGWETDGIDVYFNNLNLTINTWYKFTIEYNDGTWRLWVDGSEKSISINTTNKVAYHEYTNLFCAIRYDAGIVLMDEIKLWVTPVVPTLQLIAWFKGEDDAIDSVNGIEGYSNRFPDEGSEPIVDLTYDTGFVGKCFKCANVHDESQWTGCNALNINDYRLVFSNTDSIKIELYVKFTLETSGDPLHWYGIIYKSNETNVYGWSCRYDYGASSFLLGGITFPVSGIDFFSNFNKITITHDGGKFYLWINDISIPHSGDNTSTIDDATWPIWVFPTHQAGTWGAQAGYPTWFDEIKIYSDRVPTAPETYDISLELLDMLVSSERRAAITTELQSWDDSFTVDQAVTFTEINDFLETWSGMHGIVVVVGTTPTSADNTITPPTGKVIRFVTVTFMEGGGY
jgi:hypothetical protein